MLIPRRIIIPEEIDAYSFVKGQVSVGKLEARLLEIAGTSGLDLKVPVGGRAIAEE